MFLSAAEDARSTSSVTNAAETYEIPTSEHGTDVTTNRDRRLTQLFVQHYMDMNRGAAHPQEPEEGDKSTKSADVSLDSSEYDDAWGASVQDFCSTNADEIKCTFCEESVSVTVTADIVGQVVCSATGETIPTITVSDERGVLRSDRSHRDDGLELAGIVCEDDEHVYDVIRDSDVEDEV